MARGGPQPGSGRPKGVPNKKTLEVLEKAREGGVMPLDVLLDGMRYYYNLYKEVGDGLIISEDDSGKVIHTYRSAAKDYAIAAAPYLHPKLSSIDAKVQVSNHETALAALE